MHFDLPLPELQRYAPPVDEPADFDAFWAASLADARRYALDARFTPADAPAWRAVRVWDASFSGYDGERIRAWLLAPPPADDAARPPAPPLPCLVSYVGYGGGRGLPLEHLAPLAAGFAHFVMDTRGQGAGWSRGDTPDSAAGGPQHPGFMTRGIESREGYYYRRLMVDAARAIEAAAAHPAVDPARIAVGGASQGGGLALAAAALMADRVRALLCDVPFLCHFRQAVAMTDAKPYSEIAAYLKVHRDRVEQVFATLAYFDGAHFAPRVRCPALFSVGLMDLICPPRTVFAAYNRLRAERDMCVYAYNEHEGGGAEHAAARLAFLAARL